jgi:NADH-quinone oxidoreductase subunit F
MDFDGLKKCRNRLGTGAVIVFDQKTCLVAAVLNLMDFFVRESCGYCTPCREALPFIRDLIWRIENGEGKEEFIPMLRTMGNHTWKSYCAFAPGATMPLLSLLDHFPEEIHEHISQRKCPFRNSKKDASRESARP